MSTFLTDEWLLEVEAALSDLPAVDRADATVQYVVSGAPSGKVQFHVVVESGRFTTVSGGKHGAPTCTVTLGYPDAAEMFAGELGPEVAFMSGRAKVEGDHRAWLLDLRPVRTGDEYATAMATLRASTEI